LNGVEYGLADGTAVVIPAGTEHNIMNSGQESLKLYTIYSPPEHRDGIVHVTKQDGLNDQEDHFDGKTTTILQESSMRQSGRNR
jgi:uncharacterized cupin superfamily protein